jgi:ABC-type bacteriocin/lantibiotic exporter with double-glycine peptidase domain
VALALGAHVRLFVAQTSRASRLHLVGAIALALSGRITLVATAFEVSRGDLVRASAFGAVLSILVLGQQALAASGRALVERDLHDAAARAILRGDVFTSPADLHRAVFETIPRARSLVVDSTPHLVADLLATIAIAPLLFSALPTRLLAIAASALLAILIVVAALRGITRRMERRVVDAYQAVVDRMMFIIEGRLEIVAHAREEASVKDLESALAHYSSLWRVAAFAGALLGRAPLAAGVVVVGFIAVLDTASRDALTVAVLGQAVLLAACLPPIIGTALSIHELVRSSEVVRPLTNLFRTRPRGDLARRGSIRPRLPSTIIAERMTFAYLERATPVLEDLSFEWSSSKALILVGPNGSGKSTLLRQLIALRDPTSGVIRVGDVVLEHADAIAMREDIAYLPQRPYLGEPHRTVRDALKLMSSSVDDASLTRALERCHLVKTLRNGASDPLGLLVGELSAGQRQRVALARVLLRDAAMVLLDEPDANLDREGVALIADLVRELVASGKMVAIAAHTPELATMPGTHVTLLSS